MAVPYQDPRSVRNLMTSNEERDPHGKSAKEPGSKLDAGKCQPTFAIEYFPRSIRAISDIGEFGAKKYTRGGWKSVPNGKLRYLDAAFRHLLDIFIKGHWDKDSRMLHLSHAAWNVMAVLELVLIDMENGQPTDLAHHEYPRTEEGATD